MAESCECHILNTVGQMSPDGDPDIILSAESTMDLKAVLATAKGDVLPGAEFTFSVASGSAFAVANNVLTATTTAGEDVLTATAANQTCSANLTNIGTAPVGGLRITAINELSGALVSGVEFVVDTNANGSGDITMSETTAGSGIYEASEAPSAAFDVSAFVAGYNYISLVGVSSTTTDLVLPLSPRPYPEVTGGFSGELDFGPYEKNVGSGDIEFGLVSGSFPLKALLNFDLSLFIGEMVDSSICDEQGASAPGCYEVSLSGFEGVFPLPGGLIASLAGTPIKESYDVAGLSGRRFGWCLAGQLNLSDLSALLGPLLEGLGGDDDDDDAEDAGLDIGGLLGDLVPLFGKFASCARGNIPLKEVPYSEWTTYVSNDYGADRSDNVNFPKLDGGTGNYGKLGVSQPLRQFTAFDVPALPADPASTSSYHMEGNIILTGVNTPGQGFVPLGLGVAPDCNAEGEACLDRAANPGEFDTVINGMTVCDWNQDPKKNECGPDVLDITESGVLADGKLGLFHALPHSGLQDGEPVTMLIAAPVSDLMDTENFRASALIERGTPSSGDNTTFKNLSYPTFPSLPADAKNRTLAVSAASTATDTGIQWLTLASEENATTGMTTRWNIFYGSNGGTFKAPAIPSGFDVAGDQTLDPFSEAAAKIFITHMGFRLPNTLDSYATNNGTRLDNILDDLEAFSAQTSELDTVDAAE
ncbi:MAG: hypothetical protein QGI45_06810 [Myxococcota bacterium]|jgi:hypothetical protein|nr:hypothetical protein [Myxococcota bacterium]